MGSSFSLEYYDRIFGGRNDAYRELLAALANELADYASALPAALVGGDAAAVSRLRHSHRPLVDNLRLVRLRALEDTIRDALEQVVPGPALADLGTRFQDEALLVARALISERLPGGPGPQPPSPGG